MKKAVLLLSALLSITLTACSRQDGHPDQMRKTTMENTAFDDYVLTKFWPTGDFFETELVEKLAGIRKRTLALFQENSAGKKALLHFHRERVKKFYRVDERPHIKSSRIIRQFEKDAIDFAEYELILDNGRKTTFITAKKNGLSPKNAVLGIHGTNGDREYFLDILSHPVRRGKAHQSTVGFLLPLVDAGFLVVCPDLPGMGLDYPGKSFDDETFSHNVVYADQLARLCGFSYMNEAVYRLMAVNDFILDGTCGPIKKLGVTGFSLGGQCAVCLAACDNRVNSVLEFMGLTTYEKFIQNSPDKINRSTYVYGSGLLENVGDQWVFSTAIFPRNYKKVICRNDEYVDYDGVTDICELMQALYHADESIFEVDEYPHNHYLNADMKENMVTWFKKM